LPVMKTAERAEARRLRKEEGRSVKELAGLLGVSPSSISLWVRDIDLTDEQREALRHRMGGRIDGSRANNLFVDHEAHQREIEDFWLHLVGVSRARLRKTTVNRYSKYSTKKRQNKLPFGTCRITVCDTSLVQNLYGAIQEYGGFEREEWVM